MRCIVIGFENFDLVVAKSVVELTGAFMGGA